MKNLIGAITALFLIASAAQAQNMLTVGPEAEQARIERLTRQAQALNPAAILARQDAMLNTAAAQVQPGTKGRREVFVVGFAGDGTQDVFLSEVEFAAKTLATRYQSEKRTLLMVNNVRSLAKYPLATEQNLRKSLKSVAAKMNGAEDVLLLFITSHGSPDRTVSVQLPGFQLVPLSSAQLRRALDDSGVTNRVIIISACFAGGFIPALENNSTVVIAAASYNRTSFGCANERALTFFGDAFFQQTLPKSTSLLDAYDQSLGLIALWERRDGLVHSQPMLSVGDGIRDILADIERKPTVAK